MKKFPITLDHLDRWFRRTAKEFMPIASRFAGKPIVYVEIGTWGGPTSEWVCRNVLTHPESRGFGIDPYDQSRERRKDDVAAIQAIAAKRVADAISDRYQWIYEPSSTGLRTLRDKLNGRPIDLLYIDGIHEAPGVLEDFVQAWPMLRVGSVVIFDDYVKGGGHLWPHVKETCAAIELAYRWYVRPITRGRQYSLEVVRKDLIGVTEGRFKAQGKFSEFAQADVARKRKELSI